ncbi:NAD-dependent epimerase/dehydratase family protein [Marivirga harenae]|uniref:NAD-dependent epimerase/dehydratase family protein n=1 Tax=Marivirga harenae TaxID=2010992 RepID=UPI0026DED817|nr:NAD-dependent epimerase/dehydratase family protein [Marivirga harenae]WKV12757.1 NAD-dependent epimerase/dehydratase family protein [Marivirga harenae]|tara:strand:- start:237 stop:1427 length:1191 start_codon:yes stop_codon:yes gene_type:complete
MKKEQSRREFIVKGIKSAVVIPFLFTGLNACNNSSKEKRTDSTSETKAKSLKILILGGTSFLGPHQISYAMKRGHSISTFTRGKTKPTVHQDLFDHVEQLIGDRKDDLTALHNRKWDVVIDNSGHDAEWTRKSAELLKENCDLYVYTSSTGVYYPYIDSDYKEGAKVLLEEPEVITDEEEKIEYWYGVMKANSELEAIKQFGKDKSLIVRPTYMIGPADKSNRFIHWTIRLSQGGEVLVPGKEKDLVQYIDVRDVAEWMIRLIEDKKNGTYNAVGPKEKQTMYSFVEEAKEAFPAKTTLVKIDDYEFLREHNISDLVPWIMPTGKNAGSAKVNNEKAIANGLSFRPLAKTVKDTYDWWNSETVSQAQRDKVELDPKSVLVRERTILTAWQKLTATT